MKASPCLNRCFAVSFVFVMGFETQALVSALNFNQCQAWPDPDEYVVWRVLLQSHGSNASTCTTLKIEMEGYGCEYRTCILQYMLYDVASVCVFVFDMLPASAQRRLLISSCTI